MLRTSLQIVHADRRRAAEEIVLMAQNVARQRAAWNQMRGIAATSLAEAGIENADTIEEIANHFAHDAWVGVQTAASPLEDALSRFTAEVA